MIVAERRLRTKGAAPTWPRDHGGARNTVITNGHPRAWSVTFMVGGRPLPALKCPDPESRQVHMQALA